MPAIGVDQVRGGGYLTLLAGRAPTAPDEIVLGAQTLRALHAPVGADRAGCRHHGEGANGPGAPRVMRVVGTAVFPDFGLPGLSDTDLGSGALVGTPLLSETIRQHRLLGGATCYNFFLLRYRPGTDRRGGGAAARRCAARRLPVQRLHGDR